MTAVRPARLAAACLLGWALLSSILPVAARADGGQFSEPPPPATRAPGPGTSEQEASGKPPVSELQETEEAVGNCSIYVREESFGVTCPSAGHLGGRSAREILDGQPFVPCKPAPLPPEMVAPANPGGRDGTWMVLTCLDNVTVDGEVPGQKLRKRVELVFYPAGVRIPELSDEQLLLWNIWASEYPSLAVVFGPVQPPRVDVPAAFWLTSVEDRTDTTRGQVTTPDGTSISTLIVADTASNPPVRAYILQTFVWPGAHRDEDPVRCAGAGVAQPAQARPTAGAPCTLTYTRSSAHLEDQMYNLAIEVDWVVEQQVADGTWAPVEDGQIPKTSVFRTPVHEIQAIVVRP